MLIPLVHFRNQRIMRELLEIVDKFPQKLDRYIVAFDIVVLSDSSN